jgi:hypothetical protein
MEKEEMVGVWISLNFGLDVEKLERYIVGRFEVLIGLIGSKRAQSRFQ